MVYLIWIYKAIWTCPLFPIFPLLLVPRLLLLMTRWMFHCFLFFHRSFMKSKVFSATECVAVNGMSEGQRSLQLPVTIVKTHHFLLCQCWTHLHTWTCIHITLHLFFPVKVNSRSAHMKKLYSFFPCSWQNKYFKRSNARVYIISCVHYAHCYFACLMLVHPFAFTITFSRGKMISTPERNLTLRRSSGIAATNQTSNVE